MKKPNKRDLLLKLKEITISRGRGLVCGICGKKLTYEWDLLEKWREDPKSFKRNLINIDIDHITPKSKIKYNASWWSDLDNLQLTHMSCNRLKKDGK